jgi:hypothetical protein
VNTLSRTFKATALTLISVSLAQIPLAAAAREGAQVIVDLKSGERFSGELIAVRPDSILVLDRSGLDRTCELGALTRLITKPGRRKAVGAALMGGLAGAVGGAAIGVAQAKGDSGMAAVGALVFAPLGGVIGAFTASLIAGGRERTYVFAGMTDQQREAAMVKLKAVARVQS